jgi:AbiA family abortive infection protein
VTPISQKDLLIYKELIQCLGQGEFPLIENSVASSYLATVIYLEHPDTYLYEFIDNKETEITDFYMVRYVDDLYILFNSDKPENTLTPVINRVIDTYSSELKKINLSLNRSKTTWKKVSEINDELKKSLYDEQFNNKEFYITDLVDSSVLLKFLGQIQSALTNCILDTSKYLEIINSVFCFPNTEYTPDEIFNSLIYEKHQMFGDSEVVDKLFVLFDYDYRFLKLDTKRLMILVLKTKNENLIKQMLSNLFEANRNGVWDIYDTSLAINYLLQRNFRHRDLLNVLKKEEGYVYSYYDLFCRLSFMRTMEVSRKNYIQKFIETIYYKKDDKLFFLYFMYMIELKKRNYLSAFAYYKNFFDRISAHLGLAANKDSTKKGKPNYNNYYKEGVLKTLYGDILGSGNRIRFCKTY